MYRPFHYSWIMYHHEQGRVRDLKNQTSLTNSFVLIRFDYNWSLVGLEVTPETGVIYEEDYLYMHLKARNPMLALAKGMREITSELHLKCS